MIDSIAKKIANEIIEKNLIMSENALSRRLYRYKRKEEIINFMFGNYRNLGLKLTDNFGLMKDV